MQKPSAEIKAQVAEHIQQGAGIKYDWMDQPMWVAYHEWTPHGFAWFMLGGDNMQHVHLLEYETLRAPHSLGLEFYIKGQKKMKAYLAPIREWHTASAEEMDWIRDQLQQRDKTLTDSERAAEFKSFFESSI